VAVVATLAMSVSYLDRQALAAIAPTVRAALGISHERFGWLTSAFAGAYLAFAPLAGRVVDRFGARRTLAFAVLLWSAVAAMHSLAGSFLSLVVLRIALGTAESPSFPAAAQTIRGVLPKEQRSAGFGLLFTGSSIGAMTAAPLAVRIAREHGFRFAFIVTAAVGLAWLPLWLWFTRPTFTPREPVHADDARSGWTAIVDLLGHPAVQRQAVMVAASAPALGLVLSWFPQYLVEAAFVPKDDVGHYLWLPPLLFDVSAVLFGIAASARDRRAKGASHAGLMLLAALLTATLALAPLFHGPWIIATLGGLAMAGGGGMYVIGTADLMRRVPPEAVATAGGISAAVQSIAQITTSPIIGAVVDRTHAWWTVLVALGIIAIPGALVWARMPAPATIEEPARPVELEPASPG
jgi:ACS family hexuronate transporter-like MFS transporter